MRRIVRVATLALTAATAVVGIAACTGSHDGGGGSASKVYRANAGGVAGAVPAVPRTAAHAEVDDVELGTAKIRTADMSVTIRHGVSVSAQADAAERIAQQGGGEVDADDRTSGDYATATLVLRVPPDQLTPALNQFSRLGVEKSRHLSTQDVTAKVADVTSRVTSARLEIARLRDLYQRATRISDVITVESELAQRESDLESLEAQQRALAAQTATAAITLTLASAPTPPPAPQPQHHRSGFLGGLHSGWDAFTRFLGAIATVAGAVLPFALLALALLVAGRLLWPRLRRTPAVTPPQ